MKIINKSKHVPIEFSKGNLNKLVYDNINECIPDVIVIDAGYYNNNGGHNSIIDYMNIGISVYIYNKDFPFNIFYASGTKENPILYKYTLDEVVRWINSN